MSGNSKYKAREKHSDCNNDCSGKSIPDASIDQATLIPNKCREDHKRRWQNIANSDTIEEYT
jgi:hypothetical protein